MSDVLMLAAALVANTAGLAWLALAMEVHWAQVRGPGAAAAPGTVRLLRGLGALALAGSLVACLRVDHVSMASLVWIMALAGGALAVTFTLSWRPQWLRPLVAWVPRAA